MKIFIMDCQLFSWVASLHVAMIFLLFTVVGCGTLNNPANGQVSHTAGTTFTQTATYSCDTGYNLVGDSNRICQATGVWSGRAPTCQGIIISMLNDITLYMYIKSCLNDYGEHKLVNFSIKLA